MIRIEFITQNQHTKPSHETDREHKRLGIHFVVNKPGEWQEGPQDAQEGLTAYASVPRSTLKILVTAALNPTLFERRVKKNTKDQYSTFLCLAKPTRRATSHNVCYAQSERHDRVDACSLLLFYPQPLPPSSRFTTICPPRLQLNTR